MSPFDDRDERDAIEALNKLDFARIEKVFKAVKPAAARAAAVAGKPIPYCEEYCAAKPVLKLLLPVIGKVPVIGPRVRRLVELLMRIADSACGC